MNRRMFIAGAVAAAGAYADAPRSKMGIAVTCYMSYGRPKDTLQFLEHANTLGAGGIQMPLTSKEAGYIRNFRARAEGLGMYFEAIAGIPSSDTAEAFDHTVAASKEAGALAIRVNCLPGRRYENFTNRADWEKAVAKAHANIDLALRIVEKHQVPLAIENHKDWTADEMAALMKAKASRWLGVCLDTGNNISLLDDPMAVVETLAPYAVTSHVKDMGVALYPDGFLLSEVPMGTGMLDMRRIVDTLRRARPNSRITLEMITRDPLKVPCLTDAYWPTFPDRSGVYLARTLRMVRERQPQDGRLPMVGNLSAEEQLRIEEDNVQVCLRYAREHLSL